MADRKWPAHLSEEPWNDPEARKWLREALTEMVPKMEGSAVVVSMVPQTEWDIKYAVELGAAVMMDKPIISVVRPGTPISAKLALISDHIIEIDFSGANSQQQLTERLGPAIEALLAADEAEKGGKP